MCVCARACASQVSYTSLDCVESTCRLHISLNGFSRMGTDENQEQRKERNEARHAALLGLQVSTTNSPGSLWEKGVQTPEL